MSATRTLGTNIMIWIAICAVIGWLAALVPHRWLETDTFVTRTRSFERDVRVYDRLRIRRWKGRLPESNSLGRAPRSSKRTLNGRSNIPGFIVETRRAEYVHWAILCAGPCFFLWSPNWVARTMTLFGIGFNLPFIAVQRFNRMRAVRCCSAPVTVDGRSCSA